MGFIRTFVFLVATTVVTTVVAQEQEQSQQQQTWSEQPANQEVNPSGDVVLRCAIRAMRGECRWEKDGTPVGIFPGKYEWAAGTGGPADGDCSLRIRDARLAYDDGVWQCSVTPSSYLARDALISEGAQVVIRGELKLWAVNFCGWANNRGQYCRDRFC